MTWLLGFAVRWCARRNPTRFKVHHAYVRFTTGADPHLRPPECAREHHLHFSRPLISFVSRQQRRA